MFGHIEKLEEELFEKFEEFEVVEEFEPRRRFNSKEEEDSYVDDFIKKMDLIDAESEVESDNFKNSHLCKILKAWLESDE